MTAEAFYLRNSAGDTVDLNGPVYVVDHDGLLAPSIRRVWQEGPQQHGASQTVARLQRRVVTLGLAWVRDDTNTWTYRSDILEIFNRPDYTVWLDTVIPAGTRRLDVRLLGGLSGPRPARHDGIMRDVVQVVADDPVFYDPTPTVYTFALAAGGSAGPIPLVIPWKIGASTLAETQTITYTGTWREYPIVKVTGPITDCVITNNATSEKLDLTGTTIADGDYYEIDLRYGYKTVTDSSDTNQIADLTNDSDLATWHLAPHSEATDGVNSITVTGTNANTNTVIAITYYNRYMGI